MGSENRKTKRDFAFVVVKPTQGSGFCALFQNLPGQQKGCVFHFFVNEPIAGTPRYACNFSRTRKYSKM